MNQKKGLYRDTENARIAGVCAGVANYFGIEIWLVRILTVTGFFLLAGPFVLVTYIACWFILDKKQSGLAMPETSGFGQQSGKGWRNHQETAAGTKVEVKTKAWQAGEPPKKAFHHIQRNFNEAERRLRAMEKYVTSREFQLNREISRL